MWLYIAFVALLLVAFVAVHGTRYLKSQAKLRRIQADRQKRKELELANENGSKDSNEPAWRSMNEKIDA